MVMGVITWLSPRVVSIKEAPTALLIDRARGRAPREALRELQRIKWLRHLAIRTGKGSTRATCP